MITALPTHRHSFEYTLLCATDSQCKSWQALLLLQMLVFLPDELLLTLYLFMNLIIFFAVGVCHFSHLSFLLLCLLQASLMSTIINLAQDFVGTNNVNLLQPIGQFGTRLAGGKDAASPRYIFTLLSPLAKTLFNPDDDHGLNFLTEDNLNIEPEWYCPILPTVLINGCDGIGTGYSTTVPNHDPREVVENLKRMMNGMEPVAMVSTPTQWLYG